MFALRLSTFIKETRLAAIEQARPYEIIIDLDEGKISRSGSSPVAAKESAPSAGKHLDLPTGMRLLDIWTADSEESRNGGTVTLPFSEKGYSVRAILHFEDQAGRRFSFDLAKFSGDVSFSEGYLAPPQS